MTNRRSYRRRIPAILASIALLVQLAAPQSAISAPRAPKFTDNCKALRKPFAAIKNYRTNQTIKGGFLGALAGLAAGAIDMATQKQEYDSEGRPIPKRNNILPWMIGGALAGGAVGYFQSRAKRARDRDELRAIIASDATKDNAAFSPLTQQLLDLGNCRRQQIFDNELAFSTSKLESPEALKRLTLIERWVSEDDALVSAAAKKQTQTVTTYAKAIALADSENPSDVADDATVLQQTEAQSTEYQSDIVTEYVTAPDGAAAPPPVAPIVAAEPLRQFRVTSPKGARLRAAPAETAEILDVVPRNTQISGGKSGSDDWVKVKWDGKDGYIHRSLLALANEVVPDRMAKRPEPPKPPKGPHVTRLSAAKSNAQPRTAKDQVRAVVGTSASFSKFNSANKNATASSLAGSRERILSGGKVINSDRSDGKWYTQMAMNLRGAKHVS